VSAALRELLAVRAVVVRGKKGRAA